MNVKEWLFPALLAMSGVMIFQYFMGPDAQIQQQSAESGQSFVAPVLEQAQKPLDLETKFASTQKDDVQLHNIVTKLATYTFSTQGAVLQSCDLQWQQGSKQVSIVAQGEQCFLLGLQQEAPLTYSFDHVQQLPELKARQVSFSAKFHSGTITKVFTVYDDTYQVDLKVNLDYRGKKEQDSEKVRILFVPATVDQVVTDIQGFVNKPVVGVDVKLQDVVLTKDDIFKQFWFEPKTFGFSSKFIVHGLVHADNIQRAYFHKLGDAMYQGILQSGEITQDTTLSYSFYLGPKIVDDMVVVKPFLEDLIQTGWMAPLTKPMLYALNYLKEKTGNYGIAIILLTLLLKLLMLPLTLKGEKSMRQQKDFAKKMEYLKQKYGHDKEALNRASAELIQKHGMPGFSGCLPLLLNIPVFLSLNRVLMNSFELYGSSFLWIPDLSAADPYYVLAILVGFSMVLSPVGPDPKQAFGKYGLALVFAAFTAYLSAGLVLFIFVNTALSVLQTQVVKRFG